MAERGLTPSAFALPGLSKDSKKPFGFSGVREDYGSRSVANETRVRAKDDLEESSSLVDELGTLLPPLTEYTLENLTKSRPRSPRRRSPSPLARRKELENNSNFSFDIKSPQTLIKDHEDFSAERVNVLKERPNFPPSLILSNDVGLSVSSRELSQSRSSPRLSDKPRTNRPEAAPKSKIGAGFPDRQTSVDSAIASRLSKYETPYCSRQRKPVEKTLSANRRRFKPVTLTDEDETTN